MSAQTPTLGATCSCGGSHRRSVITHTFPSSKAKKNLHLNLNGTPPSINKHRPDPPNSSSPLVPHNHPAALFQDHLGSTCGVRGLTSAGECCGFFPPLTGFFGTLDLTEGFREQNHFRSTRWGPEVLRHAHNESKTLSSGMILEKT